MGENSSFIFTVCVKSVPRYPFELAYVVLQMAVKEFFENHFKNGDLGGFNRSFFFLKVISGDRDMPLIYSIYYEKWMLNFHSHLTFTA